jgi:hypothetical protein
MSEDPTRPIRPGEYGSAHGYGPAGGSGSAGPAGPAGSAGFNGATVDQLTGTALITFAGLSHAGASGTGSPCPTEATGR